MLCMITYVPIHTLKHMYTWTTCTHTFTITNTGGATITTPSTDDDGNSLQDSPGALAGIIITAVAVVAIIVVVFVSVCYCCKYSGDPSEKKVVQDKSDEFT